MELSVDFVVEKTHEFATPTRSRERAQREAFVDEANVAKFEIELNRYCLMINNRNVRSGRRTARRRKSVAILLLGQISCKLKSFSNFQNLNFFSKTFGPPERRSDRRPIV